jgi:hypothetical protein
MLLANDGPRGNGNGKSRPRIIGGEPSSEPLRGKASPDGSPLIMHIIIGPSGGPGLVAKEADGLPDGPGPPKEKSSKP